MILFHNVSGCNLLLTTYTTNNTVCFWSYCRHLLILNCRRNLIESATSFGFGKYVNAAVRSSSTNQSNYVSDKL